VTAGTPYIYQHKNYSGWTNVANYLKGSSGERIYVMMNGATTVPQSLLAAIKGWDVTPCFVLKNGIRWTVYGEDIYDTSSVDISAYSSKNIPASVIKTVTGGAISRAQITVGEGDELFGFDAKITVKLNKKRAGRTAYIYCYDPETRTLDIVSRTKITSNGYCSFTTDMAGDYLIVIK
jgi:hypothetical protein